MWTKKILLKAIGSSSYLEQRICHKNTTKTKIMILNEQNLNERVVTFLKDFIIVDAFIPHISGYGCKQTLVNHLTDLF